MRIPLLPPLTLLLAAVLLTITGCKDHLPTNPAQTGTIVGRVVLNDESIAASQHSPIPLGGSYGGVRVSLVGTDYSTVTQADGSWQLKDVPAGIYDILFEKDGFTWNRIWNQQFVGNGTLNLNSGTLNAPTPLYKKPSFSITSLSVTWSQTIPGSLELGGEISAPAPADGRLQVALYYSKEESEIRNLNPVLGKKYVWPRYNYIMPNTRQITGTIYDTVLSNYPSGTTIYMKAYPVSGSVIYGDPAQPDQQWVPGVGTDAGASDVLSIVVP